MASAVLQQLCQLAVEGRVSEAISLICQEIGSSELRLEEPDRWGQLQTEGSSSTHWSQPLHRQGRLVGILRGKGPRDQALLEQYAPVLALALPDTLPVLARMSLEAGTDAFWTLDLDTGAFSCTERLKAILGCDGSSLLGPADALRPEDRGRFRRDLAAALDSGAATFSGVYEVRHSDGAAGTVQYRTTVLRHPLGAPSRLLGVVADITEREEARRGLELQRQELRARASLAVELAELATHLIHAEDAKSVEALGARAFASLLGVGEAAFVRPLGTGWELRLPTRHLERPLPSLEGTPVEPLLGGQGHTRSWEPDRHGDPLSRELSALGHPAVEAFALDAGVERLGVVLALGARASSLGAEARVTGVQLAVMLGVSLARLEDQARLRLGQRQLEDALRLTRSGSWVYEVHADRVVWSRALCELNGLPSRDQVLTRRESAELTDPADLPGQARAFGRLLTRGGVETWMTRVLLPDGRRQHRRNTAAAERSPQGTITTVSGVSSDVTAEIEAQVRLERNEALLSRAGALAHVGGWEYEVATDTLVWNEETRRIHQVGADFSPSLEVWLLFYEARSRPKMGEALRRCLREGTAFDTELKLTTARGGEVWVRAQGQAERVAGKSARLFGAFQDITQQREAREAVLLASRAKSQFLANTSHEIRTPLNGILGMTQLALDAATGPEQREYLEAVATSGHTLLAIVNDILDISKIESGKLELESVPVVLERLIHEVVRSQAPRAHAKGLHLVASTDAALAAPTLGDPVRLGQIVTNLVGNAIKFTELGEVAVEARPEGTGLRLTVRDTGIGIPPERRGVIFEAFTQGDGSTSRRFGGTGLGLTITRELVTRMGGRIEVTSTVGQGTTFEVLLPLSVRGGPTTVRARPAPARVLVVEAHQGTREALCHALQHLGAHATGAATAAEALPLLTAAAGRGQRFELVLGERGPESALFTALDAESGLGLLPRMLLTTTTERVDPAALVRLRVARTLIKPVAPWELAEALASLAPAKPSAAAPLDLAPAPPRALRVLLAEDNAINARLAVRLLEKLGHSVKHVVDGEEAVEASLQEPFQAVLMDMQMPRLDGLEATRRIRARERSGTPRLPIIALTANAMMGDDALCLEAGMDAYLTKPIDLERLREALERHGTQPALGRATRGGRG